MATQAQLNGFLPANFKAAERLVIMPGSRPAGDVVQYPPTPIADARLLQAKAASEADFFAEHGFVLLPHATAVRDWAVDRAAPAASEVARLYMPEIEAVIRERLYPGRRVEIQQFPFLVRRGRDTDNPDYADGVHSDHGLHPGDYQVSVEAFAGAHFAGGWRRSYERDAVEAFVVIDFWRTTNMAGPLAHMPLALCEPASVDLADVVPTAMTVIAPSGLPTHHLALRHNERQSWVSYPGMRTDELLAFKLFETRKDDPGPSRLRSVFHSAFVDPGTPADAEPRQSCEHRVGVLLLRD